MKTYFITLNRIAERANYIQKHINDLHLDGIKIPAVDGRTLSRDEIVRNCNSAKVENLRWWLSDGAIGCALSHKSAYIEFLKSNDEVAFIIEDDVILPDNINTILLQISKVIKSNEIILLYFTSYTQTEVSSVCSIRLYNTSLGLYYPMDVKQVGTAAAYCIGREAANGILKKNTPVEVTADCWHFFYDKNAFKYFRILYPSPVKTKNFKSSIDYFKKGSLIKWGSEMINTYKIPGIYQFLKKLRAERLERSLHRVNFIDKVSEFSRNISATWSTRQEELQVKQLS